MTYFSSMQHRNGYTKKKNLGTRCAGSPLETTERVPNIERGRKQHG